MAVTTGEAMSKITPNRVREWAIKLNAVDEEFLVNVASAWEADIATREKAIQRASNTATELARQLRVAEARVEALERQRDMLCERLQLAPLLDIAFLDYLNWRKKNAAALVAEEDHEATK